MSDQDNGSSTSESGESLTNVKAEFSRKLSNIEQKYSNLESTNAQLLATLQAMSAPKAAPTSKLEDVWFDKPSEAAARIKNEAKNEALQEIRSEQAAAARNNQTLSQLVSEFPELSDGNHDLTKKAVEIYSAMSPEDKTSPLAYKAAVREAASELAIMPKSKRREDDDFSISGGGSSSVRGESRPSRQGGGIDKATEEFARLVGVDIDDPKVKERIKSKHNRRTYNKWE
jgi:hypothetical protein